MRTLNQHIPVVGVRGDLRLLSRNLRVANPSGNHHPAPVKTDSSSAIHTQISFAITHARRVRGVDLISISMKLLLIIAAAVEAPGGLILLLLPSVATSALLGTPLDTPAGLVAARIAGAALVALAIACWQARNGERGSPARGVVEAILFYNFAATAVLVYAGIRLNLRSALLWPVIVLHLGLGVWCLLNLRLTRRKTIEV